MLKTPKKPLFIEFRYQHQIVEKIIVFLKIIFKSRFLTKLLKDLC